MQETRWWKYVTQLIGNDSYKDAAEKARFDKSAFSRWKKGATADPEFVVKLARAYRANVLAALVESGLISEDEAKLRQVRIGGVQSASDEELISEILHRMKADQADWAHQPISQLESDLDQRRAERSNTSAQQVHTPDYDQLITDINSGKEQVAAQEATEPLEEHHP